MMIVERNYADRVLILLSELVHIFPEDYQAQLQLLEQQLNELSCDEDLIIFVIHFLKKYLLKNSNKPPKAVFFEECKEEKASNINCVNVKIDELIAALNWLLDGQNQTEFKGIIR